MREINEKDVENDLHVIEDTAKDLQHITNAYHQMQKANNPRKKIDLYVLFLSTFTRVEALLQFSNDMFHARWTRAAVG